MTVEDDHARLGALERSETPLSEIPPARRMLVRSRIALLEEYLALPRRGAAEIDGLAARMGVSRWTAYSLARAWRSTRDPARLVGRSGSYPLTKTRIMGDEGHVEEALRRLGPFTSIERAATAIVADAAASGTWVRSLSAMRRLVRRLQSPSDHADRHDDDELAIDQCCVGLPLRHGTGVAFLPIGTFLLHPASGSVLAGRLAEDREGAAAAAAVLRTAIGRGLLDAVGPDGTKVACVRLPHRLAAPRLIETLRGHGIRTIVEAPAVRRPGTLLTGIVGRRLGGLRLHERMTLRERANRRVAQGTDLNRPLDLATARDALAERLPSATVPLLRLPTTHPKELRRDLGSV